MLTYDQLPEETTQLRTLVAEQATLIAELRERVSKLEALVEQQAAVIQQQAAEIEQLKRRGKRQAAPFSKGSPKTKPKTPGRKKGKDYGKQAKRSVPDQVDRSVEVGCPLYCPHCEAAVLLEGKASQFQVDLPKVAPQTTEFVIHWGRCSSCGRRVQGRLYARRTETRLEERIVIMVVGAGTQISFGIQEHNQILSNLNPPI